MKHVPIICLCLAVTASVGFAQDERDPDVTIELKSGERVEGKLYKYANGTYMLLSQGRIREVAAADVAILRHRAGGIDATPKDNETFQQRVDRAIDRGAASLAGHIKGYDGQHPWGVRKLMLYALIHAGRKDDRALIKETIVALRKGGATSPTYEHSILALALALEDHTAHRDDILAVEQFLIARRTEFGGWGYGEQPSGEAGVDNLSTSQFAALALLACQRVRLEGKKRIAPDSADVTRWRSVAAYWIDSQLDDGGWEYFSTARQRYYKKSGPRPDSYLTMTCAGISSLAIARLSLADDTKTLKAVDAALERGKAWLNRWVADGGGVLLPSGMEKSTLRQCRESRRSIEEKGTPKVPSGYALYTMEKACDHAGLTTIGGKDWYRENAEWLIGIQNADGSWNGDRAIDTAFVVLFLKRASNVILTGDPPGGWSGTDVEKEKKE